MKNWIELCEKTGISEEQCLENIEYFYAGYKKSITYLPRFKNFNRDFFVEGIGLYIAEGATSEKTNEIALSNTNPNVLRFYMRWLKHCFDVSKDNLNIYVYTHDPNFDKNKLIQKWFKRLYCTKISRTYYYKKSEQECGLVVCSRAVLRYLLNELINEAKQLAKSDKKLAHAYLRGILAGEGHVYINEKKWQHHVEFGLKDKKEIGFIMHLLYLLDINFYKNEKPNFTKIVISWKKNIEKLIKNGGFGSDTIRTAQLLRAYRLYKK